MNEAIRFQIDRWLKDISARHVLDQLRICWIDIYLKLSDVIITDANKQFVTKKFKQYASNMKIAIKTVFIEANHSIEMMKRYHDSLRRVYSIITTEILDIDLEIALQMTFKVINNSIELDELIFILLVFEVYFRIIEMNVSSFTITQRIIAMKKITKEMKKFNAISSNKWRTEYTQRLESFDLQFIIKLIDVDFSRKQEHQSIKIMTRIIQIAKHTERISDHRIIKWFN